LTVRIDGKCDSLVYSDGSQRPIKEHVVAPRGPWWSRHEEVGRKGGVIKLG
jgi:hypothetical protein